MELRQINYFITVAEELHFRKAADRIGISQPALSQQIQQLEEEIGGELFIRSKRKVSLTEAGKAFLPEAISLITQSVRAVDITRKAFSGLIGELTIGFVESATWDILPSILKIYRKLYPEVRISLLRLSTAQQVKQLAENKNSWGDSWISGKRTFIMLFLKRRVLLGCLTGRTFSYGCRYDKNRRPKKGRVYNYKS